jgi:hypothetical protein
MPVCPDPLPAVPDISLYLLTPFAFDDVGAFESLVHDGDPRSAGIILSPF